MGRGDDMTMATFVRQDPRFTLDVFAKFDVALHETWGKALEGAVEPDELDVRTRSILQIALDAVVHFSLPVIEQHVEEAFEAGSNILEILESQLHVSNLEGGTHGLHD